MDLFFVGDWEDTETPNKSLTKFEKKKFKYL